MESNFEREVFTEKAWIPIAVIIHIIIKNFHFIVVTPNQFPNNFCALILWNNIFTHAQTAEWTLLIKWSYVDKSKTRNE